MIENINVGSQANDGTGDKLRNAFIIVNENFASIEGILTGTGSFTINQVQGLQTALDNINSQLVYIPSLQSDVNDINTTIYTINQTLNSQNISIADLYTDITNLQNQIYTKIGDAPIDGNEYVRKDGEWSIITTIVGPTGSQGIQGPTGATGPAPDTSIFVPYIGATGDVDLGEHSLSTTFINNNANQDYNNQVILDSNSVTLTTEDLLSGDNNLLEVSQTNTYSRRYVFAPGYQLLTNVTEASAVGKLKWNDTDGTVDLGLKGGNVTLQIGQENVIRVVNKTATNITLQESAYQAVRITGAQGNRLKVDLAQATSDLLSAETIGLVTETIANNQEGFITTSGLIRGINTTGSLQSETWADGDILYLSPTVAGRITNVKPQAPNHLVIIGYVVSAHITQGQIFVKVDNGYELDELHNVLITGATQGDILQYNSSTQVWENRVNNSIQKSVGPTYTTNSVLTVTQAEYDAIVTKDPTTLYFIV